jgi:O-antigen ligase
VLTTNQTLPPQTGLLRGGSPAMQWGRLFLVIVACGWLAAPVVGFTRSLSFLTVVGFVGLLFGFRRPAFGVLAMTLVCTLDPLSRHFLLTGGLLRWNTFNYCLLVVMLCSPIFLLRVGDLHSRLLKMFIVLLALQLVISPAFELGIQHLLGVVPLFGLLVYFAQGGEDSDMWFMVGLVNGVAGALGGLMFYVLKDSLTPINNNAWAIFPETALFCICLGFRHAASRHNGQLLLGILAATNFAWIFLTGSRGGLLIGSVAMMFVTLTMRQASHRIAYATTVVLLAAAVSVSTVFVDLGNTSVQRITKMLDDEESAASRTNGRSDLALAGLHIVRQHPLGVGTGGFAPTWAGLGYVPGLSGFMRGQEFQAHSGWVKVLAENGWLGFLLMVMYVGSFAARALKTTDRGLAALGWTVTATLAVAFLSTEFQGKGFWMLAAGATAQLDPREMVRAMGADVSRFGVRPRRVLSRVRAGEAA